MSTILKDAFLENSVLESLLTIASIFVMLTSIMGGILMLTGLENNNLSFNLLAGTPFTDFFVPGILLIAIVGSTSTLSTIAFVKNMSSKAIIGILCGAVLSSWITIEILLLNQPGPTVIEIVYLGLGLVMIVLSYILKKNLKN